MTQSMEDYLESVYMISLKHKVVRVKDIAEMLAVKKPSVLNALKELEQKAYLIHEKYGYIELTDEGIVEARKIYTKHNTLKNFLMKVIGVSEATAENDACKMEHILAEETVEKLERYMLIQLKND